MSRRGRALAAAIVIQDRQEAREAKVLHLRYPCCSLACRYDLDVGDEQAVKCPRCGLAWVVTINAGSERGAALAGRPLGVANWRTPDAVKTDEVGVAPPTSSRTAASTSPRNGE